MYRKYESSQFFAFHGYKIKINQFSNNVINFIHTLTPKNPKKTVHNDAKFDSK